MVKPLVSVLVPYRDKPEMDFMIDTWTPLYAQRAQLDFATLSISKWLTNDMHGISKARNALIEAALDRHSDLVYFLDSDMPILKPSSSVEALRLLVEAIQRDDVDIVSGLYLERLSQRICARKWNESDGYGYYRREELEGKLTQVAAVGMGCCLIDTRIFNAVEYPWFKYGERLDEPAEDIYFCARARDLGFKIWTHGDVVFAHWGKKKFTLDDEIKPLDSQ